MPRYMWSPDWDTGDAVIDGQHQALFQQLEKLTDEITAESGSLGRERAIAKLERHIADHFEQEQERMEQTHYPGLGQHITLHKDMLIQLEAMVVAHLRDPEGTPFDLMNFITTWHLKHIAQEDKKFADYLKTQG